MRQWEFYRLDDSFYEQVDLILSAIKDHVLCGENGEEDTDGECAEKKFSENEKELREAVSCLHKFLNEMLLLGEEYFFSFLSQVLQQRAEERGIYLSPAGVQCFLQLFFPAASREEKEPEILAGILESEAERTEREGEKFARREMRPETELEAETGRKDETAEEAAGAAAETVKAAEDVSILEWSLSVLFPSCSFHLLWEHDGEAGFYMPEQGLVLWVADDPKKGKKEIAGKNMREQILLQRLGRSKLRQLQVIEVTAEEARNHHLLLRVLRRAAGKSRAGARPCAGLKDQTY